MLCELRDNVRMNTEKHLIINFLKCLISSDLVKWFPSTLLEKEKPYKDLYSIMIDFAKV